MRRASSARLALEPLVARRRTRFLGRELLRFDRELALAGRNLGFGFGLLGLGFEPRRLGVGVSPLLVQLTLARQAVVADEAARDFLDLALHAIHQAALRSRFFHSVLSRRSPVEHDAGIPESAVSNQPARDVTNGSPDCSE